MFYCRRLTSLQQTRLVSQDADRSRRSQSAPIHLILPVQQFPRRTLLETVWKVFSERDGGLRCAPWRAGDTPRICPTNGVASAHIFLSPQGKDALGFTAYGRSSTPSSTCLRAAALGGCCRRISRPGRASTTGSEDGASTGRGSA